MEPTFVSARMNMSRLRHRELIEFAWFGCWTTSYLKRMEQGSNMRCKTFLGPTCSNAALHTLGSTEAFTTTNKQYIAFTQTANLACILRCVQLPVTKQLQPMLLYRWAANKRTHVSCAFVSERQHQ